MLFSVAALLSCGATTVLGQSALDGFDPNANGSIQVIVVQPDGKILLGGVFTTLAPNGGAVITRNRMARLNPDGTLDAAFNPNVNAGLFGYVNAIAIQADGRILVGGNFSSIGGQTRNSIARLDPVTGLADSFDPNANGDVWSLAVGANGNVLVGGQFTAIGAQPRNRIARLDATTGLADSFDPDASGSVYSIIEQTDGKILVAGAFNGVNSISGQTRNRIARLNPTTGLVDSFDPNASNTIFSMALQADGKILAGGAFANIGGQPRSDIARLDPTTGLADSFNANANDIVLSIAVQSDGKILAGGVFTSIGGHPRIRMARLDPITGLADLFDPNVSSEILTIAAQPDGKILLGGSFNGANGVGGKTRNYIARLETDGRLDQTLNLGFVDSEATSIALQADGKILIGGQFSSVLGIPRNNIARLNTDGTLDLDFNPNVSGSIGSIVVQPDSKILIGGSFTTVGGQMRNYIARLDASTGLPDAFDPNASYYVRSIAVQADLKVLVAGGFHSIGGQQRNYIARLDGVTGLADAFDPNANNTIYSMAIQTDGKILVGGAFNGANSIGGRTRNYIARLDGTSGMADSFDPNIDHWVTSMLVQPDGKIVASGVFSTVLGVSRGRIVRLNADGTLDPIFNPNSDAPINAIAAQADGKFLAGGVFWGSYSIGGQNRSYLARIDGIAGLADSFNPNPDNVVDSITVQPDGKVLVGGVFNTVGGAPRSRFARLSNNTSVQQDLTVSQTSVTWTRSGSGPQFSRVAFDYSTDNLTYTPLGSGAAAGSSWTLTGLNLPTGQNIYVRARGSYRSGLYTNSESICEAVRNAFLTRIITPTPEQTPRPTFTRPRTHGVAPHP